MFSLKKPSNTQIRRFITAQQHLPFSYPEVGATRNKAAPSGYNIDHTVIRLGTGSELFIRAAEVLKHWEIYRIGWLQLLWPSVPMKVGSTVGILIHQMGVWSLNACRVVYLVDEETPIRRYGFAYGTLPGHAERGEELFTVEWRPDDSIWYDVYAFSRPSHVLSMMAYPFARRLQKRFVRDAHRALLKAIEARS